MNRDGQRPVAHHLDAVVSDWAPLTDTTDIDEATELPRHAFFPLVITPSGMDSLHIRVKAEQLPLLSIGYLDMGGAAVMRVADMPGYQIGVAVSGHSVTKWPDGHAATITGPGSATVFKPGTDVEHMWSRHCAQLGINIASAQMMTTTPTHSAMVTGRPPRRW